jgi:hypothetical protein
MALNKLEMNVTLENYDKNGWFICPLCTLDDIFYGVEYCPQCGAKFKWDEDLLKIEAISNRRIK